MKAAVIGLLAYASTAVGGGADIAPPTRMDLDFARTNRIHEATGLGGIAHCLRFAGLRCTRSLQDRDQFRCTYREWTRRGPWTRKTAVLRKDGSDWRWLSGDEPKCSIMLID